MTRRSISERKKTSRRRLLSFLGAILIPAGTVFAIGESTESETPKIDERKAERLTVIKINERREDHSLDALEEHNGLTETARKHSRDMAERDFFSHENPDGEMPSDRVDEEITLGENIYKTPVDITMDDDIPVEVIDSAEDLSLSTTVSWMNSNGHRDNIINERFNLTGVGIHIDEENYAYVTQLYGFY